MVRITKKRVNNQRKNPCGFPLLPKYLYNSNSSAQIPRWMRVRLGGLRIFRGFSTIAIIIVRLFSLSSCYILIHTHFVMYNNKNSEKYLHIFTVYYSPKIFFTNIYITIEHGDTHIYTHTWCVHILNVRLFTRWTTGNKSSSSGDNHSATSRMCNACQTSSIDDPFFWLFFCFFFAFYFAFNVFMFAPFFSLPLFRKWTIVNWQVHTILFLLMQSLTFELNP